MTHTDTIAPLSHSLVSQLHRPLAFLAVASLPALAQAHDSHNVALTLGAAAAHPWTGLDHLLALIGIGLWASTQAARQWHAPLLMLLSMLLGAVFATSLGQWVMTEPLIAASVMLVGLALACRQSLPHIAAMAAVGLFGWLHGAAHATAVSGSMALTGMALGSAAALGLAWLVGTNLPKLLSTRHAIKGQQWLGSVMALVGLGLLIQRVV